MKHKDRIRRNLKKWLLTVLGTLGAISIGIIINVGSEFINEHLIKKPKQESQITNNCTNCTFYIYPTPTP